MSTLEQLTKEYVTELLPARKETVYSFHDLPHTKRVVKAVKVVGEASGLTDKQVEIAKIAAWFHDVGYVKGYDNYVEHSVTTARHFLQNHQMPTDCIVQVESAIRAIHLGLPQTLMEQVIYDADQAYLSSDSFFIDSENRRKEHNHFAIEPIKAALWWEQTLNELQTHVFHTDYAQRQYTHQLRKNAEKLEKKLAKYHSKAALIEPVDQLQLKLEHEQAKIEKPFRGVETLFRTTSHNHIELSKIADNKAHLMIQVNSIIISLVVSVLLRRLEDYPYLIFPTSILVIVSLVAIIFAVLATRPQVSKGTFTAEELNERRTNLLYFGNFYQMNLPDYEQGMDMILGNSQLLYSSMIHDLYYLGQVLGNKYRYIRISYTVFMYGFSFAIICFAVSLYFFSKIVI